MVTVWRKAVRFGPEKIHGHFANTRDLAPTKFASTILLNSLRYPNEQLLVSNWLLAELPGCMTYSLRQDLATLSGIHFYLSSRPMYFVALYRPRYSSFVARVKYRAHSPSKSTVQQWSVHVSSNGFIWQHGAADLGESIQLSLECPHKYQVWGQPVSCVLYLKVDLVFNYIDVYIWWNPWISYIRTADWNECVCSSHLFGTN